MTAKTLYLARRDKRKRSWHPIGRLDADVENARYRFRFTKGAKKVRQRDHASPLLDFPDIRGDYRSRVLFALFRNRVIAPGRPDRRSYLENIGLREDANPIEVLSVNGGRRMTDSLEVFPELGRREDGRFECRFLLRGWRYATPAAQERIGTLKFGDRLIAALEFNNPATGLAVQIQTDDHHVIGWSPRFLVADLAAAAGKDGAAFSASVVRVNPHPAPSSRHVLIEIQGNWGSHQPMKGGEYLPIAGQGPT